MDNRDPKNVGSKPTPTNQPGRIESNFNTPRNTGTNPPTPPNPPRKQSETEVERGIYRAQEQASNIGEKVQEQARSVVSTAQEQARTTLTTQKSRAAGSLQGVAKAFRQTGTQLRNQDQGAVAGYAESVADQIERFSNALENRDVDEMVTEVKHYARRHPEMFIGGAFVLGMLAARFLKSSAPDEMAELERPQLGMYSGSNYPVTPGHSGTTPGYTGTTPGYTGSTSRTTGTTTGSTGTPNITTPRPTTPSTTTPDVKSDKGNTFTT